MTNLKELRELLARAEIGASGPPAPSTGWARRFTRRLALRAMKPYTVHQQAVNRQLAIGLSDLTAAVEGLADRVEQLTQDYCALDERLKLIDSRLRGNVSYGRTLESRLEVVRSDHALLRSGLLAVEQIVSAARFRPPMSELALEPFPDAATGRVFGFRAPAAHSSPLEDLSRRLLDVFAGAPELAEGRRSIYLDVIGERSPVVDIGCGRGDFLDLLRGRGISCVGVDPDAAMLAAARDRGHHELVEADANSYLVSVPDGSLGVVFCAQVLEHLPADYLLRFMALALSKLMPGGLLIAEAPNPHSPHASKIFWVDITHRGPVFPEVALTVCWALGFGSAYVFHPAGSGDAEADRFSEPEFALVATKALHDDRGSSPAHPRSIP